MFVIPLILQVRCLGACLVLPSPSRWLIHTFRLGYVIQFARRSPKFTSIHFTSLRSSDTPVLRKEIKVDVVEPVPPADMKARFYSPYLIVPKKGGGLRPILNLRILNWALHKFPFKMLTQKCIFECIRPRDWFAAIDAWWHILSCLDLPQHRPFLWFAFEGQVYQWRVSRYPQFVCQFWRMSNETDWKGTSLLRM